jgi:hypothetical protein
MFSALSDPSVVINMSCGVIERGIAKVVLDINTITLLMQRMVVNTLSNT